MILALIDYLKYRFRKGPYSAKNLERDGWFFADESSLHRLDGVHHGDLLFCYSTNSLTSWAVMYLQGALIGGSHVAMLTEGKTVIEAITAGVSERPASVYFDGKHFLAIQHVPRGTPELELLALHFTRSQIGNRYSFGGVIRLGLEIIIGTHHDWRPRLSIDVFIILFCLWIVAGFSYPLRWTVSLVAVFYGVTVLMFSGKRKSDRARLFGASWRQ